MWSVICNYVAKLMSDIAVFGMVSKYLMEDFHVINLLSYVHNKLDFTYILEVFAQKWFKMFLPWWAILLSMHKEFKFKLLSLSLNLNFKIKIT